MSAQDYKAALQQLFEELAAVWDKGVGEQSQYLDETVRQQMVLPPGSRTRLCAISVPLESLSLYRDWVYPIAAKYGFSPVNEEDIVTSDENRLAKLRSIIERCELLVADVSGTSVVMNELEMAFSRERPPRVLVIKGPGQETPPLPDAVDAIITRSHDLVTERDVMFLSEIDEWFAAASQDLLWALEQEPERLLALGESRAAVIAAFSFFEVVLRDVTSRDARQGESEGEPLTLSLLIGMAERRSLLTNKEAIKIEEWRAKRNQLVHLPQPLPANAAADLVERLIKISIELRTRSEKQLTPSATRANQTLSLTKDTE